MIHFMKLPFVRNVLMSALILTILVSSSFFLFESSMLSAQTSAADTVLVTLTVTSGIAITSPADTSMSINLGVVTNTAVATTTWNVKTNDTDGYILAVKSSLDPAMQSLPTADIINDYTEVVGGTPEVWDVPAGFAEFGYSATGTDVSTGTWGTGTYCNGNATSTVPTGLKYIDFDTSDRTIASRGGTTTTTGIDTVVCYAVEQDGFYIPAAIYTATITATATVQ